MESGLHDAKIVIHCRHQGGVMAIRNVLLNRIFEDHNDFLGYVKEVQERDFPWSLSFSIRFLPGHVSLVFDALREFEAIVGKARLADDSAFFFWGDADYGPSIFMFANGLDKARLRATIDRCNEYRTLAAYRCKACGRRLDKRFDNFCPAHLRLAMSSVPFWYSNAYQEPPASPPSSLPSHPVEPSKDESDREAAKIEERPTETLEDPKDSEKDAHNEPLVHVWFEQSVGLLRSQLNSMDPDSRNRIRGVADRITLQKARKPLRRFSGVAHGLFADLRMIFPNFGSVIDYLEGQCALSVATGKEISLDPILIHGRPGYGKSAFIHHLAMGLNLSPPLLIDMSSAQGGSALSGSEQFWSNSNPGRFFWHLVCSAVANPLVVLEEIDKVVESKPSAVSGSPIGALHGLLERHTACRFFDLSLPELSLDASHVLWFATCNIIERVPDPIRQRFLAFEIPAPDERQARNIAISVFTHLRHERGWSHMFDGNLNDEVLTVLAAMPPREMRKRLAAAVGRAVLAGRRTLLVEDLLGVSAGAPAAPLALH